ncbi:hypothetical protein FOL46_006681 [Perkinsus olseni]|uniref:Uncharacterized protein n=1 Tax=Perkinsus olseni TaxID=32597 RepID=A0A7J6MR22_PEROL|nr:hypothetical protein FOL46_006681 [Perkinsus olseni]
MSFWNFLGLSGEEEVQKPPAPVQQQQQPAATTQQRPQSKSPGMVRTTVSPSVATGGYAAPAVPLPRRPPQVAHHQGDGRSAAARSSSISSSVTSMTSKTPSLGGRAAGGPSRFSFVNKPPVAASSKSGPSAFGFINRPNQKVGEKPPPPPPPPPARTPSPSAGAASPASSIGGPGVMGCGKDDDSANNKGTGRPLQSPRSTGSINAELPSVVVGYWATRKLYRDEKTQLSVRRKSSLAEYKTAVLSILKSASRENDVINQLKDVLDRQNQLVEEEQFDEASEMENEVTSAREAFIDLWRGMADRAGQMRSVGTTLRDLDDKSMQVTAGRITVVQEQLAALHSGEGEPAASSIRDEDGRLQQQRAVLEADLKSLEEMRAANEAEEAEIRAARSSVEDAIEEVTGPVDEERRQVMEERDQMDDKIKRLQEELAEAQAKRDECDEKMSRLDGEISAARGKFRDQLSNVEAAEEKFSRKAKAMELKEEIIDQQRKTIQKREDDIKQRREEKLENRRKLEEELGALDSTRKASGQWLASSDKLGPSAEAGVDAIVEGAEFRAKLRRQVADVADKLSSLDLEIGRVRSQLNLLQQRRPQIEEEKQQAVRSRMFAEAKKLSAEAKSVDESITSTETSLRDLRDQSAALRQQLDEAQSKEDGLLDGSTDAPGCGDILEKLALSVKARLKVVRRFAEEKEHGLKPEIEMLEALDAHIAKHLTPETEEKLKSQLADLVDSWSPQEEEEEASKHDDEAKSPDSSEGEPLTSGDDVGATGSDSYAPRSSSNDDTVKTVSPPEDREEEDSKNVSQHATEEVTSTRVDVLESELAQPSHAVGGVDTLRSSGGNAEGAPSEGESDTVDAGEVETEKTGETIEERQPASKCPSPPPTAPEETGQSNA